ncbi:uncharacterized protein [Watersipora subatra]|uniref:uncharacterized protein n=1 Tax=Watersipora subatra TaxID=2589382 RepID=UPI00355B026D
MDLKLTVVIIGMLAARSWAISCYNCGDCAKQQAVKAHCSIVGNSDSCYATYVESTGIVSKSCGTAELDQYNIKTGCIESGGVKACRCKTDYCNTDALISSSPAISVSFSLFLFMLAAVRLV